VTERIPDPPHGDLLLVTIQVDMHDQLARVLQDDLTSQIEKTGAKGVLIDISALDLVDSFIGRMIANISAMSRILDAQTVVVGMRPAVADHPGRARPRPGRGRYRARRGARYEASALAPHRGLSDAPDN
jgi:anti-anti-sigma regulatory factor